MPSEIKMPQQSDTMTEGTVVKWTIREGGAVKAGQTLAEIETDKATMEMESFEAGKLAVILVQEGEKVPVGTTLGVIAVGGEDPAAIKAQFAAKANGSKGAATQPAAQPTATTKPATAEAAAPRSGSTQSNAEPAYSESTTVSEPTMHPAAIAGGRPGEQYTPNRPREEEAGGMGWHEPHSATTEVVAAQFAGKAAARNAAAAAGNGRGGRLFASPLAKRIAADKGIDLQMVTGTGPGGRIIQRDVLEFKPLAKPPTAPAAADAKSADAKSSGASQVTRVARGTTDVQPMSKMRSAIAAALQRSKQQIPHFYVTVDVDVEELFNLRVRLNKALESEGVKVSVNDFVTKACCNALLKHPAVNAHFTGDSITRFGDVHIGVAVAIPDGLIVPVIKSADQMGLKELQQRTAELAKKAKAQKLKGDEMKGATFTISNLGMFGVKSFNAIINPPEVAILAVSAAEKRPVVRNDQIVARQTMTLTLSVDHRAVDGAAAAEFMRTLKGLLEEPGMMLV